MKHSSSLALAAGLVAGLAMISGAQAHMPNPTYRSGPHSGVDGLVTGRSAYVGTADRSQQVGDSASERPAAVSRHVGR